MLFGNKCFALVRFICCAGRVVCLLVCMCVCVRACVRACVCVCVREREESKVKVKGGDNNITAGACAVSFNCVSK